MTIVDPQAVYSRRFLARLREPRVLHLGLTVGAGWGGRIVTAVGQFYAIRLLSAMLGVSNYAAYAVFTGLFGWFMLADFGFGSSLQNLISERRVAGRTTTDVVATAMAVLLRTTLVVYVLLLPLGYWAGPVLLRSFPGVDRDSAIIGFIAYAYIACGTGAAQLASRILFAEHRGYYAHAITASAAIVGMLDLTLLAHLDPVRPFAWALFAYNMPNLAIPLVFLAYQTIRSPEIRRIVLGRLDLPIVALLWRQARTFLLFNVLTAMVLYVDYIILSQTAAPRTIAVYAIFSKVYALVFFVFNSVLQAYWPLSAEAIGRGDFSHLRGFTIRALSMGGAIVIGASLAFYVFLQPIARILTPADPLTLPASLIVFVAIYWCFRVWSDTFSMLIMSAGRPFFLCGLILFQAAFNLVLGYLGARYYGLPGLMLGMSGSFLLTGVWAGPWYIRRISLQSLSRASA